MQHTHTQNIVTGRVETERLLSRQRQLDYSLIACILMGFALCPCTLCGQRFPQLFTTVLVLKGILPDVE